MEDQVGVDLVGHKEHVIGNADVRHLFQLFFRPHDAQRVMGTAQQENLYFFRLSLKILKIDGPASSLLHQLVFHHNPSPGFGHIIKFRVHGSLDHNLVAGIGEDFNNSGQGRHHAQGPAYKALVDLPAIAALLPAADGVKITVWT